MESEDPKPLSAEMKVDEENVLEPTSNDELIENSDQEPTEVQVLTFLYTNPDFFFQFLTRNE